MKKSLTLFLDCGKAYRTIEEIPCIYIDIFWLYLRRNYLDKDQASPPQMRHRLQIPLIPTWIILIYTFKIDYIWNFLIQIVLEVIRNYRGNSTLSTSWTIRF
ncbi:hypothetical protein HI914_04737 [Erysiphe necator]|nr:hypothetical protein HI914_04737 [Erysiphe necator]